MASEPLIVTFSDARYLPLLGIWLDKLQRLGLRRIRIYGLDSATLAWCRERGVDAAQLPWQGDLRELWVKRIGVFRALLAAGEEFIHSDADAIWLRNPLEEGSARDLRDDLLFSQGTVWPPDVHQRWGFVLCCGWFWARPTTLVHAFFEALEREVRTIGDDQICVNRLLAAAGAAWQHSGRSDYQLAFQDRPIHCWSAPIRATFQAGPLTVALLPHGEFQRLPEPTDRAVVKHYLTPKNCEQKLITLRELEVIA
jgi:hypothetical protein